MEQAYILAVSAAAAMALLAGLVLGVALIVSAGLYIDRAATHRRMARDLTTRRAAHLKGAQR